MARELKRLNINFPDELVDKIDAYADNMNLNRTSAMIVLINTALEQKDTINLMNDLLVEYKKNEEGE